MGSEFGDDLCDDGWDLESCSGLAVSIWDSGLGRVSVWVCVCSPMRKSCSYGQRGRAEGSMWLGATVAEAGQGGGGGGGGG